MSELFSFGAWVRQRRRALDLTREELAAQVGCSIVTIRHIEADERRPSKQLAARLADGLQLGAEERGGPPCPPSLRGVAMPWGRCGSMGADTGVGPYGVGM